MLTHSTDDWNAFTGREHLFFGMANPFSFLRDCIEGVISRGAPGAAVASVRTFDAPKHLAVTTEEPRRVQAFGITFRAHLDIARSPGASMDRVDATISVFLGDLDKPGRQRVARFIDLGENGVTAFADPQFAARFLEFQRELGLAVGGQTQTEPTSGLPEEAGIRAPAPNDRASAEEDPAGVPPETKPAKAWWKFWRRG